MRNVTHLATVNEIGPLRVGSWSPSSAIALTDSEVSYVEVEQIRGHDYSGDVI